LAGMDKIEKATKKMFSKLMLRDENDDELSESEDEGEEEGEKFVNADEFKM